MALISSEHVRRLATAECPWQQLSFSRSLLDSSWGNGWWCWSWWCRGHASSLQPAQSVRFMNRQSSQQIGSNWRNLLIVVLFSEFLRHCVVEWSQQVKQSIACIPRCTWRYSGGMATGSFPGGLSVARRCAGGEQSWWLSEFHELMI